jgi:hypothetical protein
VSAEVKNICVFISIFLPCLGTVNRCMCALIYGAHWGRHHSDPCTSTVSDLLCNPLLQNSVAPHFEQSAVPCWQRCWQSCLVSWMYVYVHISYELCRTCVCEIGWNLDDNLLHLTLVFNFQ